MTKSLLNTDFLQSLKRYNHIFVGYSGGLDSTVLLHALITQKQFASKLTAIHINHGLSPNAQKWEEHCQQFCRLLNLPLIVKSVQFRRDANIEDAARQARYDAFRKLLKKDDCLLLAHHFDDQAETMLLHLVRGTGIAGLAAMKSSKNFAKGQLLRPLLHQRRTALLSYAKRHQLVWIDDESNFDIGFSRNYLRHEILPLLAARWPKVVDNLVRTSQHCRQAQNNLDDLAKMDCPELNEASSQLAITHLKHLSKARLANILRVWLEANHVRAPGTLTFDRLIPEVIYAMPDANPLVTWGDICVRRYQENLYLLKKDTPTLPAQSEWVAFPGRLDLGQLGHLYAIASDEGLVIPQGSKVTVRFRQGGESFAFRGQTKQLKKLFQEWQIPTWLRDRIPLVYVNDQLACVVGYAISDNFFQSEATKAYELQIK
ncbi:cell cycle protein MesJ [Legionella lansingensis]|uniref:tRNA(Ile)-lysidine synthase n=1 Tax=Legionella lansingensis TaxID=45067 RepID=A0A0W0VW10_9GAMM|nr:tRNA lysidine(34) synthetase TilS [Legionella lansingensis]KTD24363.1 cell cycle protein MesJ [Legionella lansingensis]SNV51667.1 cell cycle protein MesJ [Legionella lansingensis]